MNNTTTCDADSKCCKHPRHGCFETQECECNGFGMGHEPIGFLVVKAGEAGLRVVGSCCAEKYASQIVIPNGVRSYVAARVFMVNVFPYRQSCCECGKVLVKGQACGAGDKCPRFASEGPEHTHWCELYSSYTADGRVG